MKKNLTKPSLALTGFLIAFIGAVLFSTKAIIVKKAFADEQVDALTLLMIRMLFSLPFYIGAAIIIRKKNPGTKLTARQWLVTIALGLFGYYLSSLFDFVGLQYISAGLERLILFLYPSFAVLINAFVFKQAIRQNEMIALLLTYLGIGLAYYGELGLETSNPNFLLGTVLIFLCSITYAIYIVGSGRMVPAIGANKFTTYALLSSTAGVFVHYLVRGDYHAFAASVDLWGYGILLAIVATVIPTFMLSAALKKIGSNKVAIISSIGPVSTILQAHYILGEEIFTLQLLGTAMVLTGVLLLALKSKN
ncbi:DMT family transporter [Terrimonas alba]|uniref:DMT family transporter n=1 Tax=Terrimonas alba TaxID=3349636 RepID=UPI0035F2AB79